MSQSELARTVINHRLQVVTRPSKNHDSYISRILVDSGWAPMREDRGASTKEAAMANHMKMVAMLTENPNMIDERLEKLLAGMQQYSGMVKL